MKALTIILIAITLFACRSKQDENPLIGSWKMVYADIKTKDSLEIKDLSNAHFIKIINPTHFAFFNENIKDANNSYSGGGTYSFKDTNYTETLKYTNIPAIKGHSFNFSVHFKGDTLIQTGIENIPEANINRYITEKYIKIN